VRYYLITILLFLTSTLRAHTACHDCNLFFIKNKGQWGEKVKFKSEFTGGGIFFEHNKITFALYNTAQKAKALDHSGKYKHDKISDFNVDMHAYQLSFDGANTNSTIQPDDALIEYFNYFIGNDKRKWASKVPAYRKLIYREIYEGVDAEFYSEGIGMKYDLYIKPNADYKPISIKYDGVPEISISKNGDLIFKTSIGDIIEQRPYAYQIIEGNKKEIPCSFQLDKTNNSVSFILKEYDERYTLVIDPTLIFSTYSGSTSDNFGYTATYDKFGNGFAAGTVFGTGYPVTLGAYQINYVGGPNVGGINFPNSDIGVSKFSADGTTRLYATYLGGFGSDLPHSLVVNNLDELYVLATTSSADFPTTSLAYDTVFSGGPNPGVFFGIAAHYVNGSDIAIAHLSSNGDQLLASTFLGGNENDGLNYNGAYGVLGTTRHNYADEARGEIDLDKDGDVIIASCSRSADFPRTTNVFQSSFGGSLDATITKFKPTLDSIIWSSTFGGSGDDAAYSVAFDVTNNLYLAGGTVSANFPMPGTGRQKTIGGATDGFVYYISADGSSVFSSSYQGFANYDQVYFVETDRNQNVLVFGQAENSQSDFIFNATYNRPNGGQFISKFPADLSSWIWSTTFGRGIGQTDISPTAFLVDLCNSVYVSGWGSPAVNSNVQATGGTNGLDVTSNCFQCTTDNEEFYLMVMRDDASALQYATFLGGINSEEHVDGGTSRFDRKGVVYQSVCAGCGGNSRFPTAPANCVSPTNRSSNCNNLLFKFDLDIPLAVADFSVPEGCNLFSLPFTNLSKQTSSNATYYWTFGDGGTSNAASPFHTYQDTGTYTVKLVLIDPLSCNITDSIEKKIVIQASQSFMYSDTTKCPNTSIQIGIPDDGDPNSSYQWTPASYIDDPNNSIVSTNTPIDISYTLIYFHGYCGDTIRQNVLVRKDSLIIGGGSVLCPRDTLQLNVRNTNSANTLIYQWTPASEILLGANTANPIASPTKDTLFTVIGTSQFGCIYTDSIFVSVASPIGNISIVAEPDTILFGDTAQIITTYPPEVVTFQWIDDPTLSANSIPNPKANPPIDREYVLEASDANGCKIRGSVKIVVRRTPCNEEGVYIPNAFTPNGDGKNDIWYVRGNDIRSIEIAVFDRWGQRVFYSTSLTTGWDGTFNGAKLDPAVFGFYVDGYCLKGDKFSLKGNVTILK
jgi:gliding motility-associated-like protein